MTQTTIAPLDQPQLTLLAITEAAGGFVALEGFSLNIDEIFANFH
jgi:hypothetical protein